MAYGNATSGWLDVTTKCPNCRLKVEKYSRFCKFCKVRLKRKRKNKLNVLVMA